MAVLSLCVVPYVVTLLALKGWAKVRHNQNRPFAPAYPDIDPPLWRVALGHFTELILTARWLIQYPSVTEVWMAFVLGPFLFIEFPLVLNNMLEWVVYLLLGNSQGNGSHEDSPGKPGTAVRNGAPPIRRNSTTVFQDLWAAVKAAFVSVTSWLCMMICGNTPELVNCNNALLCYLQKESWEGPMHHVDDDILQAFPTAEPNSRVNAVMMARCATMAYDRWHNIDQTVSLRWNQAALRAQSALPGPGLPPAAAGQSAQTGQMPRYSLLKAWSFDRLIPAHLVDPEIVPQQQQQPPATVILNGPPGQTSLPASNISAAQSTPSSPPARSALSTKQSADTISAVRPSSGATLAESGVASCPSACSSGAAEITPSTSVVSATHTTAGSAARASVADPSKARSASEMSGQAAGSSVAAEPLVGGHHASAVSTGHKPYVKDHTSVNTDVFLMKVEKPDVAGSVNEVALVLAFRGTEALQTVDWISDLANVKPPNNALDRTKYPLGFTHRGFRDCLGLKRDLTPADNLCNGDLDVNDDIDFNGDIDFTRNIDFNKDSSYLLYTPARAANGWNIGRLTRVPQRRQHPHATTATAHVPDHDDRLRSPFAVVTKGVQEALEELLPQTRAKIFVTGHSLGGALAHLYTGALLLAQHQYGNVANHFEAVYTFGEPRIGSQDFVTLVEEALRQIPGGIKAEDRFKRVVNTLDIITRIPPPLREVYQHPGHCTFIKQGFLAAYSTDQGHSAMSSPTNRTHSAVKNLIETPNIFLWPAAVTVLVKLLLSVRLLFAHRTPRQPKLAVNPINVMARLVALFGPVVPFVLPIMLLDALCLLVLPVLPFLWWVVFTEPLLLAVLLLLCAFWPPIIFSGLVDHSMAEYYTACWLTTDADWRTADRQPVPTPLAPAEPQGGGYLQE